MSQSPPSALGKYQIIREIARSNDIVYEAFDPVMNRRVALKELAMPRGATPAQAEDRIRRFLREARAAGSLVHPNIVTIYEVSQEGDRHYIAMEYLDGRTLRADLDSLGLLTEERAVEVATAVLSALSYAHANGVVHRDIKPDNIQLLESGAIKITDFGIARLTFEPNITIDGQVFGTPSYMSPEQINGGEIDPRSDLFSVGTILYEMVSGKKPFTGDNVVAISYAIMNRQPDQPVQCSPGLWHAITRAIEKSPAARWASADEMKEALASPPATWSPIAPAQAPPPVLAPTPAAVPYAPGQPYQPYQPYAGQAQAPFPPGFTPQFPPYVPPLPRKPLLSPEAKAVLAKLAFGIGLMGALVWAIVAGLNSLAETSLQPLPGAPPAVQRDPKDLIARAKGSMEAAAAEPVDERRRELWSEAMARWTEAIEASPDRADALREEAGAAYAELAKQLAQSGEQGRARQAVYQGQALAPPTGEAAQQLAVLAQELGSG